MTDRATGLGALALALTFAFALLAAPGVNAQETVNPTELSVQEQTLLDALGGGEAVTGRVSIPDAPAADLIKPGGRDWSRLRSETLYAVTVWSLLGMLALLAVFFLIRGRVRIEAGRSGRTVQRFNGLERFAHWLTAVPFVVLALTGINMVVGRHLILPLVGAETFGALSQYAKIAHNFLAWPFMVGVALIFLLWVKDNIPSRLDGKWFAQGGGMLRKGLHPPARRFNAGQKLIFWAVVAGGVGLSVTGIFLLFPALAGTAANWQLAQVAHGLVAAFLGVVILGHIYIGTLGMEGAFDAMGSGEVDLNWAREHHSLWVEEETARAQAAGPAPAKGRIAPAE